MRKLVTRCSSIILFAVLGTLAFLASSIFVWYTGWQLAFIIFGPQVVSWASNSNLLFALELLTTTLLLLVVFNLSSKKIKHFHLPADVLLAFNGVFYLILGLWLLVGVGYVYTNMFRAGWFTF